MGGIMAVASVGAMISAETLRETSEATKGVCADGIYCDAPCHSSCTPSFCASCCAPTCMDMKNGSVVTPGTKPIVIVVLTGVEVVLVELLPPPQALIARTMDIATRMVVKSVPVLPIA